MSIIENDDRIDYRSEQMMEDSWLFESWTDHEGRRWLRINADKGGTWVILTDSVGWYDLMHRLGVG